MNDTAQQRYDEWLDLFGLAINDVNLRSKLPKKPNAFWLTAIEVLREGSMLNAFNVAKARGDGGFMAKESLRDMTKAELIGLILLEHMSCNDDN